MENSEFHIKKLRKDTSSHSWRMFFSITQTFVIEYLLLVIEKFQRNLLTLVIDPSLILNYFWKKQNNYLKVWTIELVIMLSKVRVFSGYSNRFLVQDNNNQNEVKLQRGSTVHITYSLILLKSSMHRKFTTLLLTFLRSNEILFWILYSVNKYYSWEWRRWK